MISQPARFVCKPFGILAVVLLTGCSSQPVAQGPSDRPLVVPTSSVRPVTNDAVSVAMQQLGVPYRYGGATPQGFDCSGLVYYSYKQVGKTLPRTTTTLWSQTQPVAIGEFEAGDILFFRIEGKLSHVGLYIGNDRFVHAPASGQVVSVASLRSDFYRNALIRAGRPY